MAPIPRPSFSLYLTHAPAIASAPPAHASDGLLCFSRLRATLVQSSPVRVDLYPSPRLLVEAAERNKGCATFRRGAAQLLFGTKGARKREKRSEPSDECACGAEAIAGAWVRFNEKKGRGIGAT